MARTVTAQEARQRLGELLEDARRGDETIIERAGKPMGVVISPLRYERIEQQRAEAKDRLIAMFDELRSEDVDVDPDAMEALVREEIAAYRREKRQAAIELTLASSVDSDATQ